MQLQIFPLSKSEVVLITRNSIRYSESELERLLTLPFADIWILKTSKGKILGYSVVWKFKPELELHWIEIFDPFKGKGFGKAFLRLLLERYCALGYEKLLLEVSENNRVALKVYQLFKPRLVGKREGYYPDGSDALLLEIPLKVAQTHNAPYKGEFNLTIMSVELVREYFQKMDLRNSVPCGGDVKIPAVVGFVFPEQLKEQLEKGENVLILDVREECEAEKMPFKAPSNVEVKIIPIRELVDRLNEIPKDRPVITVCNFAIRATMAKMALDILGYNNVKVLKGGVEQWNQLNA